MLAIASYWRAEEVSYNRSVDSLLMASGVQSSNTVYFKLQSHNCVATDIDYVVINAG